MRLFLAATRNGVQEQVTRRRMEENGIDGRIHEPQPRDVSSQGTMLVLRKATGEKLPCQDERRKADMV